LFIVKLKRNAIIKLLQPTIWPQSPTSPQKYYLSAPRTKSGSISLTTTRVKNLQLFRKKTRRTKNNLDSATYTNR